MSDNRHSSHAWYMLALLTATGTFVAAIPFSCMPVLFKEISDDLGLTLVQLGTVWGISSLAGILVSIAGGLLSDRLGVKLVLTVFSIMVGITGALRGFSDSFFTLTLTVFINGMVRMVVPVNITKTVGMWFNGPRLGMAMGISAVGFGLGLMLGPLVSATILSPWLGGWRNVMYFYGAISGAVGVLWFFFGKEPPPAVDYAARPRRVPAGRMLTTLLKNKALWIIGFTMLFRGGSLMGVTGYLPLYLLDKGWTQAAADGTLATFYAFSTLFVVPLSLLSDKLGSRKTVLFAALVAAIVCVGLLPVADGAAVWALVIFAGLFFDGFMAIITTMLLETGGIGAEYSGTAIGVVFTIAQIGSLAAPPLGNSFADAGPGLPFAFWAALSLAAFIIFTFSKETGRKKAGF